MNWLFSEWKPISPTTEIRKRAPDQFLLPVRPHGAGWSASQWTGPSPVLKSFDNLKHNNVLCWFLQQQKITKNWLVSFTLTWLQFKI